MLWSVNLGRSNAVGEASTRPRRSFGRSCERSLVSIRVGDGAKAHALCFADGLVINRKRTQRLWREEGLKRPLRVRKKHRIGEGRNQRLASAHPDHMWALDFHVDVTVDGRQVRFLKYCRRSRGKSPGVVDIR